MSTDTLLASLLQRVIALEEASGGGGSSSAGTIQDETGEFITPTRNDFVTAVAGSTRGTYAVDLQMVRSFASRAATGYQSAIVSGQDNTSGGSRSFVGAGRTNDSSGQSSFVGAGESNSVYALGASIVGGNLNQILSSLSFYSAILGGQNNEVNASHASVLGGRYANARHYGSIAHAGNRFSNLGDCQREVCIFGNPLTSAALTELFLDNSNDRFDLENDDGYKIDVSAFAFRDNLTDYAHWSHSGIIATKNGSGNVVVSNGLAAAAPDGSSGTGSTLDLTIDADTTNQTVRVQGAGNASETWRMVVVFDVVRINF